MPVENIVAVFLDGVGLGADNPTHNPLAEPDAAPFLRSILDGRLPVQDSAGTCTDVATLVGLDAALGVPGLPQSGTGQTAILTGLNAPQIIGEHSGPYPTPPLRKLLADRTLFHSLLNAKIPVAYANAYPDRFLSRLSRGTERLSANTRGALSAGLKLRGADDLRRGRAVSALLTNRYWREWGVDVPLISAAEAGAQLAALTGDHRLVYFEMWYTDVVGHKQNAVQAATLIRMLDNFFAGIAEAIDSKTLVLVFSDHGNLDDISTRKHTAAPVLGLAFGAEHRRFAALNSLTDLAPFIVSMLKVDATYGK